MAGQPTLESTADVVEHHLEAVLTQDLDELLKDYAEESVLITSRGTFHGVEDIRTAHAALFEERSDPGPELTIDEQTVDGEVGFVVWHGETPEPVYDFATETYVVRDGIIEYQTRATDTVPEE